MDNQSIGIWLVGARGGVATTTALGLSALKRGLVEPVGLLSCLEQFQPLEPAAWDRLVVGGHEIRRISLLDEALHLAKEFRVVDPQLVELCRDELTEIDDSIRPGTIHNVGSTISGLADDDIPRDESPRQAVDRLRGDMAQFVEARRLEHLVVVNVASTEPLVDSSSLPVRSL